MFAARTKRARRVYDPQQFQPLNMRTHVGSSHCAAAVGWKIDSLRPARAHSLLSAIFISDHHRSGRRSLAIAFAANRDVISDRRRPILVLRPANAPAISAGPQQSCPAQADRSNTRDAGVSLRARVGGLTISDFVGENTGGSRMRPGAAFRPAEMHSAFDQTAQHFYSVRRTFRGRFPRLCRQDNRLAQRRIRHAVNPPGSRQNDSRGDAEHTELKCP